jgi:hypothetical protein
MINVDLETMNISRGATDCHSALHEAHDRHYDLTVHVRDAGAVVKVGHTVRQHDIGTTTVARGTRCRKS